MDRSQVASHAFLVAALVLTVSCREKPTSTVPDIALTDVRGGVFELRVRQPLLLAFLQTVPDNTDPPSRTQAVFLGSMAQQYGPRGLRVAVIDASSLVRGTPPSHDAVLNASYDWHLNVPLLLDPDARLARRLGVEQIPTVFLISADGQIRQQWRGSTRPAELGLGVERLYRGVLTQIPMFAPAAGPRQR